MKRIYLPLLIITYVLILAAIGIFQVGNEVNSTMEYLFIAMITILFISGIILGIKKNKMVKEGMATNDEMSKKIINKSAALSFYLSLVLWLVITLSVDDYQIPSSDLIGYGTFGMVTIFALLLTYFNIRGIRN